MDIWRRNGDRMALTETESSEIFFSFPLFLIFLSFFFFLSENENRASYWKGKLFYFRISGLRLFRLQSQLPDSHF